MFSEFQSILNRLTCDFITFTIPHSVESSTETKAIFTIFQRAIKDLESLNGNMDQNIELLSNIEKSLTDLRSDEMYASYFQNPFGIEEGLSARIEETENEDLRVIFSAVESKVQIAYMKFVVSIKEVIINSSNRDFIKMLERIAAIPFINIQVMPISFVEFFAREDVKLICEGIIPFKKGIYSKFAELSTLLKLSEELFNSKALEIEDISIRESITLLFKEFIYSTCKTKMIEQPRFFLNVETYSSEEEAHNIKIATTQRVIFQVSEFLESLDDPFEDTIFDELLLFLGRERFRLAKGQKTENLYSFGVRRGMAASGTPLAYLKPYGEYAISAEEKIKYLPENKEELITAHCCLQGYVHRVKKELDKETPEIREELVLGESIIKLTTYYISSFYTKNPTRACYIYNSVDSIKGNGALFRRSFQDCLIKEPGSKEFIIKIATFRYLFVHMAPFLRGTALIGEWLESSLFRYHGYLLEYRYDDYSPDNGPKADLDAFTSFSFHVFLEKYIKNAHLTKIEKPTGVTQPRLYAPLEIPSLEECKEDNFPILDCFMKDPFRSGPFENCTREEMLDHFLQKLQDPILQKVLTSLLKEES